MTKRRKSKPYDPAAAERHRAERAENKAEVSRLKAQGAAVNVDPRTGRLTGAWRMNCFNTLLAQNSPERAAVDWLDELVRLASGEISPERDPSFIPASNDGAPGQGISDTMIAASQTLDVVQLAMPPAHARMLLSLLEPDQDLMTRWRAVVQRCTGETHSHAQAAVVRAACTSLSWVHQNIMQLRLQYAMRRQAA